MNKFLLALLILLTPLFSFSQSDDCITAVSITPTFTNCNFQAGSSANATQSRPTCSIGGNADDDVWYTFVANSSSTTITVDPTVGYDAVIELYSGTCGLLTPIQCEDVNGLNGDEVLVNTGLINGNTYFFRVYHYGVGSGTSTFNVCVKGLAPPTNNTPCNAYPLATVDPSCNFNIFTNLGSAGSAVPTPTGCGGSSPFQGGYAGGDVWFSVIVPPSGELDIHTLGVDFSDGAMALYYGPCGSPILVECDDDGEPGDGILMPHIYRTGLTPGTTMYIRVWEYGNNNNGKFGICVSTPDNDDCANAQQICDLNGYGGITSSAYTIDFPSNMTGTGQNGIPNSNPTAPFGQGYIGSSPVQIDNNSWLQFTASATTATLFVQVNHCSNGNGMQMQIFSGTNCTNFAAVSSFLETQTSQSITATGLTPGNTYYIVIDGFAGDICSYTISATSGVQVVKAISSKAALCLGDTATLSAQVIGTGSYTYSWSSNPPGLVSSAPSLTVSPTQNTLYTVDVTGLCGSITTASVYVPVNTPPTAAISGNAIICSGNSTSLLASGGNSYTWNTGDTNALVSFSPLVDTTYSVIVTNTSGCSDSTSIFVQVLPAPTASIFGIDTICNGNSTILTGTGGGTYSWNIGSTLTSINVSPTVDSTYSVIVDIGGCKDTAFYSVIVNPLPIVNIIGNDTLCNGESTTLTATGGGSYLWNTSATLDSIVVSPTTTTIYNVVVTDSNNCTNNTSYNVTVNPLPIITITGNTSICSGTSTNLTANGATSYIWNTSANTPTITVTPITNTTYSVIGTDVNGCSDSSQTTVTILPQPTALINGDSIICDGESATLNASGGGSYLWTTLDTTATLIVNPTTSTPYTVIVNVGGCLDTITYTVNVTPLPVINAYNDTTIILGQSASIFAIGGSGIYTWTPTEGLSCSNCANPIAKPEETTTYCVETTEDGCKNISCVTITVDVLCGELFVPNAFSPNGDGNNDCLKVYNNCLESVLFRVYSRWGELIYESEDIDACWDGTNNGSDLNTGVYSFTVAAKLLNGEEKELKGNTTLFK